MVPPRLICSSLFLLLVVFMSSSIADNEVPFDVTYFVEWGQGNVAVSDQGRQVQISMNRNSGSGFSSKLSYGSGMFHMRIKLHDNDTAGVVTTFYLTSNGNNHDEVDFEFLGNLEGQPITLQTNVFANGQGNREQRIKLWFDPRKDFHSYKILWNQHIIIFFVDDVVIRVFKNNIGLGVAFPVQSMQVKATIWDGSDWATDGGRIRVNWSHAPFMASYQEFSILGCPGEVGQYCSGSGSGMWWNGDSYWKLDRVQQRQYEQVREKYMFYDYCNDTGRYPVRPPECTSNS